MNTDTGQGNVLVCSPNSSLGLGLCYDIPSTASTRVIEPASSSKLKNRRSKPKQKNAIKEFALENSPQVTLNEDVSKPVAENAVAELMENLKSASLGETKKPKKVKKRKKSSSEKDKSTGQLEEARGGLNFRYDVTNNVVNNGLSFKNDVFHTPLKTQVYGSPKLNEPFFPDNKKSASKNKPSSSKKKAEKDVGLFDDYLSSAEIERGLRDKTMLAGHIRINQRCYKEAYISSKGFEKDIMIEGMKNRNRALEGDEVVVLISSPENWKSTGQRTGKVVFIKEEVHSRTCVGRLQTSIEPNNNYVVFSPRDSRVPRIRIPLGDPTLPPNYVKDPAAYAETIFSAQITVWNDVAFAHGKIVEQIGQNGDVNSETLAILLENNLDPEPIDPILNIFYPSLPYKIPEEEIAKRDDLRKECIFTIDPATARDLDDAVSTKKLDNGNIEVGVHISDVSHFLQYNTLLDHVVCKRATTIYMVQRVYHMLPVELCHLCSLTPGEDKLAFSVFVELTPDAEVVSHRYAKSVIHSCSKLAYEHAQMVIDNPEKKFTAEDFPEVCNGFTAEDCAERIRDLYKLSVIMRKRRFDSGALRIDQPKLCFHLDPDTMSPISSFIYQNKESHRLIEEFMLLANMTVAEHIYAAYPDLAFLRHHLSPRANMMIKLQKRLEMLGIHLDITDAGTLHSSMLKYCSPLENEDETISWSRHSVLNQLCAKPMLRAEYFCPSKEMEELYHYALNAKYYTHFTSPIRRYADVMVHRLLAASLNVGPQPTWSQHDTKRIANICNQQKLSAKIAGDQSSLLFLALYLQEPVECWAAVVDVKDRSADVIVKDFGVLLRIYTDPLKAKVESVNEDNMPQLYIKWQDGGDVQLIQLFSLVRVQVSRAKEGLKLAATLLPSPPL